MFDLLCAPIDKGCDSFAVFVHDGLMCLASNNNVRDSNVHKNVLVTKNSMQGIMVYQSIR